MHQHRILMLSPELLKNQHFRLIFSSVRNNIKKINAGQHATSSVNNHRLLTAFQNNFTAMHGLSAGVVYQDIDRLSCCAAVFNGEMIFNRNRRYL